MQYKSFMEALKGKQHKIDKNKNGQIDSHDFKLLRKEEQEEVAERYDPNRAALAKQRISNLRHAGRKVAGARIANLLRTAGIREESEVEDELIEQLDEVLGKDAGADKWIHDFVHSTNPKFEGKSKKERINMALGAYYDTHKKKDGISEQAPVAPVPDKKYIKGTPEHKAYKATKKPINGMPTNEEVEQIEEKSEQAKQNKTMKNTMDASRGARYKLNNPVPAAEPEHKTAQAHNKAIGRALRKEEESMKSFTTVMKESDTIEEGRNEGDVPFDKPYKTVTSPVVKDKSGAKHTPISRARDLARQGMKQAMKEEYDVEITDEVADQILEAAKQFTGPVNVDKVHAAGQEPHEEKWVPAKKKAVKEEIDADGNVTYAPMTYNDFMMMLEYEADKGGRYVHKGSYGSEFAKAEREKDEKGFDAEPAKRGPKAGSKRGPRANLGNSKLHKTI